MSLVSSMKGLWRCNVWEILRAHQYFSVVAVSGWFCPHCPNHTADSAVICRIKEKLLSLPRMKHASLVISTSKWGNIRKWHNCCCLKRKHMINQNFNTYINMKILFCTQTVLMLTEFCYIVSPHCLSTHGNRCIEIQHLFYWAWTKN